MSDALSNRSPTCAMLSYGNLVTILNAACGILGISSILIVD